MGWIQRSGRMGWIRGVVGWVGFRGVGRMGWIRRT